MTLMLISILFLCLFICLGILLDANASLHIPFEFDGSCLSTIHDISLGRLWRYDGLNYSF